ncbi:nitrate reductase cytochrome c-type subunit [Ferrimonas pelagia]|uniref:Periplasmic nitrate reductase, electron transfer subunit n=1 Tax=Ferrimonas pelagia TaxID=1177826 RepID=A0ABP9FSB5_9GAMM
MKARIQNQLSAMLAALVITLVGCSEPAANTNSSAAPANIHSLRGKTPVTEQAPAPALASYPGKGTMIARTYQHQPPLIPHKPDYPITMKRNMCQNCHGLDAKIDAPSTHYSHFADDSELKGGFYFCNSCHVAQAENVESSSIVGNQFHAPGYPQ